jgi:RHS repeat-associated protein
VLETGMAEKAVGHVAMAELGTASSPAATSCRVYNYYLPTLSGGKPNPTSCAMPAQGTDNNGNVAGMYYNDSANSGLSHTASYNYDAVNRLISAAATGNSTYSQSYTYDPYGNLSCAASPAENKCIALTYSPTTNQITASGYAYDAAGKLTGDGTYTYQWDAESRLASVINGAGTAISTNTYNALGQRARDATTSNTTDEAYGAGGNLLWRYTGSSSDPNQRAFVPFNGRTLAEYYAGVTIFDHPDEIGSATTSSDYTGSNFNEKLFYPFGELWTGAAIPNLNMHQTFAQLPDYDPETDQYNTDNRHYNPAGRWLSPDPAGKKAVRLDDPQTWNMYVYARNNPTSLVDPSGELATVSTSCSTGSDNQTVCNVLISASIAVYAAGSGLTQDQLKEAASTIKSSIESAWSGSFEDNGVTYNVSTQVSVQVEGSEQAAVDSGAQNVVGLSNGPADAAHNVDSYVNPRQGLFGPDTGVWNINSLAGGVGAHEFTHLLGVGDKPAPVLSNTYALSYPSLARHATADDLRWGISEAVDSVNATLAAPSRYTYDFVDPRRFATTVTVHAPWLFGWK